jgi:hypothetical protein
MRNRKSKPPRKKRNDSASVVPLSFDLQHVVAREVFCAALTGIMANSNFAEKLKTVGIESATWWAVAIANAVVIDTQRRRKIDG